jgi:uroporphyrinogen-III decarboxylase
MIKETMTSQQRVEAAIKLEPLDRIPVIPFIDAKFPCRYQGISQAESFRNFDSAREAMQKTFDELGGYDATFRPGQFAIESWIAATGMKTKFPGIHLPDEYILQPVEYEALVPEDYDTIIKKGFNKFYKEDYLPRVIDFPMSQLEMGIERAHKQYIKDIKSWATKGVLTFTGGFINSPMMLFGNMRSITALALDIYRTPDKVKAAFDAAVVDIIENGLHYARFTGLKGVEIVLERGSAYYWPLRIFEKFEFPYIKQIVEAFLKEDFIIILHFDTDWTLNLPYFKEFPKGKCIVQLDGTTNIFKAKEIFKNHSCIMGDVPAALSSLGTPEEMEEYCKKLIDEIGKGGGFILSTACVCPVDAKYENIKRMIQTAKTYPYPK